MHQLHFITLESIHYGGDQVGNDIWIHLHMEGHRTVNGHATPIKPVQLELHPKFDKETRMASKLPLKLYQLPLGNPGNVFESDLLEFKIHVSIVEKDKFSDHGRRTLYALNVNRLALDQQELELQVPVRSHGGDAGKMAMFHLRFLSEGRKA